MEFWNLMRCIKKEKKTNKNKNKFNTDSDKIHLKKENLKEKRGTSRKEQKSLL